MNYPCIKDHLLYGYINHPCIKDYYLSYYAYMNYQSYAETGGEGFDTNWDRHYDGGSGWAIPT